MKCEGIKNPKYCLECPYPECLVDRYGNLPEDLSETHIKRLIISRKACRKYRETHKEQLKEYRRRPEVKERKRITDKRCRDRHRKAYNEQSKVYCKKYYEANRERIIEKNRKYREEHREKINARRREKWRNAHMKDA